MQDLILEIGVRVYIENDSFRMEATDNSRIYKGVFDNQDDAKSKAAAFLFNKGLLLMPEFDPLKMKIMRILDEINRDSI